MRREKEERGGGCGEGKRREDEKRGECEIKRRLKRGEEKEEE